MSNGDRVVRDRLADRTDERGMTVKIGNVDVVPTAKAALADFQEDDLQGLAAEVTYHLLFALIPLLIFFTALTGFIGPAIGVNNVVEQITQWMESGTNLPDVTIEQVVKPIQEILSNQAGGFLTFGALLALWGGKNALAAFMKALNVAFDVKETRPWWKKTAIAIGLTLALGVAIIASSVFFIAGSWLGDTVFSWLGWGSTWATIWGFLRWPLIVVLLVVSLAFFYSAGPNVTAPFRWLTPGSVLAVLLWGVATFGLSIYFSRFAGYVDTYGPLGGVLAFVFWLYLMSLILLLGGEFNSVLARVHSPETQAQLADPAKAMSGVGAKRRAASGGEETAKALGPDVVGDRGTGTGTGTGGGTSDRALPPLPPMPLFAEVAATFPSAEAAARVAQSAESIPHRQRRARNTTAALGLSAVAALSAAVFGAKRE